MKWLIVVLDYTQKAIISLLFLPLVAIAIIVGLLAYVVERIVRVARATITSSRSRSR